MAINQINIQQLIDPADIARSVPYIQNGLTYKSNNTSIHKRDAAGNIILEENGDSNPLLIIEPTVKRISTKSITRVIDTAFQYFKFPVAVTQTESLPDLNLEFAIDTDTITTRYTIPYQEYPEGVPNSYRRLNTTGTSTWFTNGTINSNGFTRLPFSGGTQLEPGTFTITPDILDFLRLQNKTIRFFIQMQGRASSQAAVTEFSMRLVRSNPRAYRNFSQPTVSIEVTGDEYPLLTMEYILNVNDLVAFDKFSVDAVASSTSWYLGDSTIWDIELIDNADFITNYDGVQTISNNTILQLNGVDVFSTRPTTYSDTAATGTDIR